MIFQQNDYFFIVVEEMGMGVAVPHNPAEFRAETLRRREGKNQEVESGACSPVLGN
jgi:hypothetical protein